MKQFPIYSLFPNHTTSKIDEHSENQITNLPRKWIQNESSRPSPKLAPIGTGRPSSNRNTSGQTNPYLDAVRTYQSTIQTETRQCFLTTSTLPILPTYPISGQIFAPFNQTQWAYQPTSIERQQFYIMNPIGIVPNQQNYSDGSTISNVEQFVNKNITVWTPLPVDGLPKLFVSHEQSQLYMWNLERYVDEKAIQGFNNNYKNLNLIIPQPLPAYDAMAFPKRAIDGFPRRATDGFPRRATDVLSGQVIHGLPMQDNGLMPTLDYGPMPRQDYGLMPWQDYGPMPRQYYGPIPRQDYGPMPRQDYRPMPRQDGGAMNIEGNNHNGNKQTMSAKQQILNPDCSRETEGGAETKDSYKNKRRIFYNSNYGRRRIKNNNKN